MSCIIGYLYNNQTIYAATLYDKTWVLESYHVGRNNNFVRISPGLVNVRRPLSTISFEICDFNEKHDLTGLISSESSQIFFSDANEALEFCKEHSVTEELQAQEGS